MCANPKSVNAEQIKRFGVALLGAALSEIVRVGGETDGSTQEGEVLESILQAKSSVGIVVGNKGLGRYLGANIDGALFSGLFIELDDEGVLDVVRDGIFTELVLRILEQEA